MDNRKKRLNKDVYKKRQRVLIAFIGSVVILIIVLIMYFALFTDHKEISQNVKDNTLSSSESSDAALVDAKEESLSSSDICFEKESIKIKIGENVTPKVLNGTIDQITDFESSDSNVAIVSENGEITGVGLGICAITAEVKDTKKLLSLRVDVVEEYEDESSPEETNDLINDGDPSNTSYINESGHQVVVEDGITYIDGIMMASKTFSLPRDFDPGVNDEALNAFNEMQADAANEGLDIYISSSYRSYEDQERIYNSYVESDGKEAADTYSARPGHSDHQTGLTFDLNSIDDSFGYTPESDWVKVNAHKYGFIIRYPEGKEDITGYQYEPWHIRYIGIEKATEVYESGLSLEEFLGVDSVYKD